MEVYNFEMKSFKILPMTRIRKTIVERLSHSARTAVHVTMTTQVNMAEVMKFRDNPLNSNVSYTDVLVKATAKALKEQPILNSRLENEEIKIFEDINIGIAVALEEGLIVPVVRNADNKTLTEIATLTKQLVEKARQNKLSLKEIAGGTFTITNLGMFDIDIFTPIINPPQSAILAVGRIGHRPVVVNGEILVRPIMTLCLSFDHRIIDGAPAAKFLQSLKQILECPTTHSI